MGSGIDHAIEEASLILRCSLSHQASQCWVVHTWEVGEGGRGGREGVEGRGRVGEGMECGSGGGNGVTEGVEEGRGREGGGEADRVSRGEWREGQGEGSGGRRSVQGSKLRWQAVYTVTGKELASFPGLPCHSVLRFALTIIHRCGRAAKNVEGLVTHHVSDVRWTWGGGGGGGGA